MPNLRLASGQGFSRLDKGPRIVYLESAGNVRPPRAGVFVGPPKLRKPHVTFADYCAELQRRLPIAIAAVRIPLVDDRAIVGIHQDPAGMTWSCALNLEALIEIETALAARAAALKLVTVH